MDEIKQPKKSKNGSCRINLHKGLREKNAEAWFRLNEVLKKLQDYELAISNGKDY
jgi:hypothetical protein